MRGLTDLCLDSDAIVKRYLEETGTLVADHIYDSAEAGETRIYTSLWNIGETLGVIDQKLRRGWIDEDDSTRILEKLARETLKLLRLGTLFLTPVLSQNLVETWPIVMNHHLYEADALQIVSCHATQADMLVTADQRLITTATDTGLKVLDLNRETESLRTLREPPK